MFFDYIFLNMFLQSLLSGVGLSRIHRFLLESGRSTSRPKVGMRQSRSSSLQLAVTSTFGLIMGPPALTTQNPMQLDMCFCYHYQGTFGGHEGNRGENKSSSTQRDRRWGIEWRCTRMEMHSSFHTHKPDAEGEFVSRPSSSMTVGREEKIYNLAQLENSS